MISNVKACVLIGLEGYQIGVETDLANGLPVFNMVGLPDTSIKESKERVRSAIVNSGFKFPISRITVNLSPASVKKEGSQLDLPIALGILSSGSEIPPIDKDSCFIGELSLDGSIKPVNGVLPMVISLRSAGISKVFVPEANIEECRYVSDIDIYTFNHLSDIVKHLKGEVVRNPVQVKQFGSQIKHNYSEWDFDEVKGQETLRRAVEVAAAGSHNILIVGSPGTGKTMIAKRIPSILPELSFEEALEITKVYSIAGLNTGGGLIENRPFRSPHHTISKTALVGGGRIPSPGEITLSNFGVLFLDELPEYSKSALEVLRQPLEDGVVTIARTSATLQYPSKFMLVAAMNPCPCGYYGDPLKPCKCTPAQIDKYLNKISGPLLDRIDIQIEASPVKYGELNAETKTESSQDIRERVNLARKIQKERYQGLPIHSNSQLTPSLINKYCEITDKAQTILASAYERLSLSVRAHNKIIKVARTIADLEHYRRITYS